ncbi:methylated-DNA--[protein]-cysteine S-methyltransferase [Polymorphum gilvum]|uniref:Methylated-DNA--protein-cysteine methyltransferase n=1 Tax=Polymorphum gilvum (strain LMG 25793 / CGMCC 1.9160 / SL003B-26A1) TaxID=991905 RepID=F2IWD3_POLGS|nr:methylated-DNA--[protein]-cysteine S-methyltransferase [Polymorphum gilvum]ADZ69232.1 Methylated-DNA--protein-cysteine methyltransferase [Polymorphum gilvum SL003B-26A1]
MPTASIDTPVGRLFVTEEDGAIVRLSWQAKAKGDVTQVLAEALRQIGAYFAGELKRFDLPLAPAGPELHQQVFKAMLAIPYGETRTYGEIARELGTYGQPVGQACGANPIPVVIPCHRVLSADGLRSVEIHREFITAAAR